MGKLARLASLLGHAALAAWVFAGALFGGRVLYLRDISSQYYPDWVFTADSLRLGIWPLWNPTILAGTPWLAAYPPDLALLLAGGADLALRLGPPLHVLLAMQGAAALARRLGAAPLGAFSAGAVYGLSGALLSLVNVLHPQLPGAAWLPWVVALALDFCERATARRGVALACATASMASSLAAEAGMHAAIFVLLLVPAGLLARRALRLALAAGLAGLLLAPMLAAAAALLSGTARGAGFSPAESLTFSASLPVLIEGLLPGFLGDVHTASGGTYWGGAYSPTGFPFLLSVYLGPVALTLAALGRGTRLRFAVALFVLLAIGGHGPLGWLVGRLAYVRAPVKFLVPASLALALLAGLGIERARREPRRALAVPALALGGLLLALALALRLSPELPARTLGSLLPPLASPEARRVAAEIWPGSFAASGSLALAAGAALLRGSLAWLAVLPLLCDLLLVNGALNRFAPRSFYELRPEVARLLAPVRAAQPGRIFSFGLAYSESARLLAPLARDDRDVWLYSLDRQALLPRAHVLDGLEGAFEVDRDGLAPRGSALSVSEASPARFRTIAPRLREANVRFVLSFDALPLDLALPIGETRLPGVTQPLRLFELAGALPRAFFTLDARPPFRVAPDVPVRFERLGPHACAVSAETPPGLIVVLEGHASGWRAYEGGKELPMRRVGARYRGIETPGGARRFVMRYEPAWRLPSLGLCLAGACAAGLLLAADARARARAAQA